MITGKLDANDTRTSETYNSISGVTTAAGWSVRLICSHERVGASGINHKRVCDQSVSASTMAADPRTVCCRSTNSNLSSVRHYGVCDADGPAAFAKLGSLFHGLGTSAVHVNKAHVAKCIDLPRKANGGLAATMTGRTRIHGGQHDKYQRKVCFRKEHDGFTAGLKNWRLIEVLVDPVLLKTSRSVVRMTGNEERVMVVWFQVFHLAPLSRQEAIIAARRVRRARDVTRLTRVMPIPSRPRVPIRTP